MQGLAAVPEPDAAVRVRSTGKADDHGLPVIGADQLADEIPKLDQLIVRLDADVGQSLMDDLAGRSAHAIARIGHQRERNRVAGAVLADAVSVGIHPPKVVQDPVGLVEVVGVAADVGVVEVARGWTD